MLHGQINSNIAAASKIDILHVGGNTTITTSKKYACIVALAVGQATGDPSASISISSGVTYIANNRKYGSKPDMSITMGYSLDCNPGTIITTSASYNHCGIIIGIS